MKAFMEACLNLSVMFIAILAVIALRLFIYFH